MTRAQVAFKCPRCGYAMDAASPTAGADPVEPKAGDLGICLWCGAPLEYAEDKAARWLTFDEVKALDAAQRAELVIAMVAITTQRPSRVRYVKP